MVDSRPFPSPEAFLSRTSRPVRRKPKRSPAPSPGRALLRVAAGVILISLFIAFSAPARRLVGWVREVVLYAAAVDRTRDARAGRIEAYARQYGISRELAVQIEEAAVREGVDPELGFRLVRVESRFDPEAESPVGALGLTQLMPRTAAELQPGITREQILDPETNLRLGFRYLHWLLDLYDGNVDEALHAYNRGPGTVARIRAAGGDPANGYADLVTRAGAARAPYEGSGLTPVLEPPPAPF